jgi:phosphate acetyltransferase
LSQALEFSGTIRVGDELTATVTALEKSNDNHVVVFDCLVSKGEEEIVKGTATVMAPVERISYSSVATPDMILRRNDSFARMLEQCEGLPSTVCAVVHPCDRDSLLGPLEAHKQGLIDPILVGPEAKIRAVPG